MKKLVYIFLLVGFGLTAQAQLNPAGIVLDETSLVIVSQTNIVADATAYGGNAIVRLSTAPNNTVWFGPYIYLQGGSYLIQVRLKVASNLSSSFLFNVDVVSNSGAVLHGGLNISPNMFRNSNEWQVFTFPVQLPDGINNFEIRGMSFQSGITDLSMDYINVVPGDIRGFYSNEYTISGIGNVGIGTINTQDYKLAVNGNIRAKEVKVETGWSDYVFDSEYKLRPLTEVSSFIKTNHHLPDVPSAENVKQNGIYLGEANTLLLKKVEELTLYIINQNQEKINQQKEIDQLKQQLKVISLKVNKIR